MRYELSRLPERYPGYGDLLRLLRGADNALAAAAIRLPARAPESGHPAGGHRRPVVGGPDNRAEFSPQPRTGPDRGGPGGSSRRRAGSRAHANRRAGTGPDRVAGASFHSYARAHANTYAHADRNADPGSNGDAPAHRYAHADTHAYPHGNGNGDAPAHAHAPADAYTPAHADGNAHATAYTDSLAHAGSHRGKNRCLLRGALHHILAGNLARRRRRLRLSKPRGYGTGKVYR